MGNVASAQARLEAKVFIEGMHARIGSAALHQHMMAVDLPGAGQCCADDGLSMTAALVLRMRRDVFQEAMPPSAS